MGRMKAPLQAGLAFKKKFWLATQLMVSSTWRLSHCHSWVASSVSQYGLKSAFHLRFYWKRIFSSPRPHCGFWNMWILYTVSAGGQIRKAKHLLILGLLFSISQEFWGWTYSWGFLKCFEVMVAPLWNSWCITEDKARHDPALCMYPLLSGIVEVKGIVSAKQEVFFWPLGLGEKVSELKFPFCQLM